MRSAAVQGEASCIENSEALSFDKQQGHLVRGFPDEGRDGNDRDRAGAGRVCVGTEQLEPSTASVDGSDCRFPAVQNREKSKQKSCIYYLSR